MKLNKILFRLVSFFMVIATMVPMLTIKQVFGQDVENTNLPHNFTVRKVDQDGKPLKGAIFEFKDAQGNLIDGIPREGEDGVIDYPITTGGKHTLKEKKAPKGYVADTKEYTIPIGVPFTVPQKGGRNVSDKVVLLNSSSRILNPSKRKGASQNVIYPNEAVGLELAYELGFVDDLPDDIKAGDYFTVKLSDNYDPTGISPIQVLTDKISLANNLGVIAEATYDPTNKTIKYTFTDYVDTFKVLSGTTSIGGYVDRSVITTSKKGEVFGYTIGDSSLGMTYKTEPIDIDYREKEAHQVANQGTLPFQTPPNLKGFPSVGSLVVSSDLNKNTFRQIIYVNPLEGNQQTTTNTTLTFSNRGNQNSITNAAGANIKIYKVPTASRKYMPYSYAYNQKTFDEGIESGEVLDFSEKFDIDRVQRTTESSLDKFTINFGTVDPRDSYVIVVDGKFINLDETNDNPQYLSQVFYDFDDIKVNKDQNGLQRPDVESIIRNNAVNYTPSSASGDGESGITIVNNEGIDIFAQKEWSNVSDAEDKTIILKLFANGDEKQSIILNGSTDSYTSNEGEYCPWRAGFWNLPPYDENGDLIKYSVKEYSVKNGKEVEGLEGFKTTYSSEELTAESSNKFITVTNTKEDEKVTVLSEKVWQKDGKPTEKNAKPTEDTPDVYFQLMNGDSKAEVPEGQSNPVQYTGKTVSWENLPIVGADGNDIQYTVKEVDKGGNDWKAPGYTVSEPTVQDAVANDPDTEEDETQPKTFTFTNNYETTSVKVTKTWKDVPEGATKPDVYFQLMNGEELVGERKQLPSDSTKVEWTNLPKVELDSEGNGEKIQYTVKEVDKDGIDWKADNYTAGKVTAVEGSTNEFTVENTYTASPGEATITATKVLTGRDLADGEFEFVLTETTEGVEKPHTETVTNVGGNITFAPISYEKAGTYTYTITETKGELPGITYDETPVNVTVVVTDKEGKLEAAVTYGNEDNQFENTYTASPGEAKITATKVLTGRELADGEFEFVLTETTEGVETPHTETVTNVGGNITFAPISYEKAGTYTYTITETKGELPGITYDETPVNVTVVVTDKEGKLETAVTYENEDSQFENAYTATPGEANITATKVITGRELADGEFEFVLTETTEGVEKPHTETVTNVGENITFAPITYDKAGTYTYTITETKGELPGVTYDETPVNVTVVVIDKEGKLETAVTYENGDSQFENTYKPADGALVLEVSKVLTGREIKDGEFSFELINAEGQVIHTVSNEAGKVIFPAITLSKTGEFRYTIKEVHGSDSTVKYDDSTISATFQVSDQEGKLVASEVVYSPDAVFENIVEETTTTEESTSTTITEISTTTTEEPTTTTEAPKPDLYDVSIKKVDQYGQAVEGVIFELYQVTQTTVEETSDSSAVPDEPVSVDTSIIDKEIEDLRAQIVELQNQRAILEAEHETAIQSESSEPFDSEHLITIESLKTQIATLEEQLEEKLAEKSALMINTTAEEFDESGLMKVGDLVEEVKVGTYITDESGLIQVSDLVEGDYYFVEIAAPAGYEFTNKPYYFNLPNDQSLLITIENCNNNTTSVEDTTTTASTTTVEDTTTTLSTTTVEDTTTTLSTTTVEDTTTTLSTTTAEDRPTTVSTTTVEDRPTTLSTTTAEDRPTTVSTTTVEDRPTTLSTTTVEDTTTTVSTMTVEDTTTTVSTTTVEDRPTTVNTTTVEDRPTTVSTTTVHNATTVEDTTTTEEIPVPSGVTSVSGGTPGDNTSTPNQQQDKNNHLPHTGESIMFQIVLSTLGIGLLTGGFLVLRSKIGYKS